VEQNSGADAPRECFVIPSASEATPHQYDRGNEKQQSNDILSVAGLHTGVRRRCRCISARLQSIAGRPRYGGIQVILYYWPGASSMVPHIVLEEIGTPYQRQLVDLARGEHKSDAYLKINPHGKVPALAVDDTVLTENVAILTYLAKRFPEAQLLPDGMIEQARCLSTMAWFASSVHTTFAHIIRPERFASDSTAHGNLKETARGVFWDNCKEINSQLDGRRWMMGTQYTVCDPYALFFYDLGTRIKLPMHELAAYAAFSRRMLERAAVSKVRGLEQDMAKGANAWHGQYYAQPDTHD
jgi:glutathione S-transferase